MVESSLVIAGIVFLVVAVIAFHIIKSILKTVIFGIAVLSIVLGVSAFFILMDFNDLKEGVQDSKNLFLVVDGNKVLSGLESDGDSSNSVHQQELDEYTVKLQDGKPEEILNGYFKVFIIHAAVIEIIDSELLDKLETAYAEERAELLSRVIAKVFSDPVFMIVQYKKGNIEIHEETIMFKAVKLVPVALVRSIADKALSKTKSIVVDKIGE